MIAHNRPTIGAAEQDAVARVMASGQLAAAGEVHRLEAEFAATLGLPPECAVATCNGTAALYLALWALEAKDRRVLVPAYSCSALRHAVAMAGAAEQLADVAPGSPNVETTVTASCDIAIVAHMYGIPARLPRARGATRFIEDAAQALGARVDAVPVGLQGDAGVFSFYATKLITSAGQGGMLVSRERALADAVRDYLDFDCRRDRRARFNFQMTDVQAAMARVQLRRLGEFLARREEIFMAYRALGIDMLDAPGGDAGIEPVRYRSVWLVDDAKAALAGLHERGVGAINPLEGWELLGDAQALPAASALTARTVSLPCYPSLNAQDLRQTRDAVDEVRTARPR